MRPLLDAQGHALAVSLPAEPLFVSGDVVRLANAVKYTPPGGHIEARVAAQGRTVSVHVKDDGMGIEADLLPRVFDLFWQAPRALDRATGGLGIGLTLVKRLVALHGGELEARSEGAGKGSEFIVRLPRVATPETSAAAPRPADRRIPGVRVLIVEDNRDAAELLAEALRLAGTRPSWPPTASPAFAARWSCGPTWCYSTSVCRGWTAIPWRGACGVSCRAPR